MPPWLPPRAAARHPERPETPAACQAAAAAGPHVHNSASVDHLERYSLDGRCPLFTACHANTIEETTMSVLKDEFKQALKDRIHTDAPLQFPVTGWDKVELNKYYPGDRK